MTNKMENNFSDKANEEFQVAFGEFVAMFVMYASGSLKDLPEKVDYVKSVVKTSEGGTYLLTLQHVSGAKLDYCHLTEEAFK